MPQKLDYAHPPEKPKETLLDRVQKAVLIIGLFMLVITSLLLDGGRMFAAWSLLIGPVLIVLSTAAMVSGAGNSPRLDGWRAAGVIMGVAAFALGAMTL